MEKLKLVQTVPIVRHENLIYTDLDFAIRCIRVIAILNQFGQRDFRLTDQSLTQLFKKRSTDVKLGGLNFIRIVLLCHSPCAQCPDASNPEADRLILC